MSPVKQQKYLRGKLFAVLIVYMNMFIPLSTDIYLPALPTMTQELSASSSVINFTLSGFFLFYALGILLWGPLSDKYGRRPILLIGAGLYTTACVVCALAGTIWVLIAARVVQGFAAGAIIAVTTAIIKDAYDGKRRESILAFVQTASGLAPMAAPMLGALLLSFAGWRAAFFMLAAIGAVCFGMVLLFQETLPKEERTAGGIRRSMVRLVHIGSNKGLMVPCLIFAFGNFCFMSYIVQSSYIYVDFFGLTETQYSLFFATNALISMCSPLLYVRFFSRIRKRWFAFGMFTVQMAAGILLLTVGHMAPYLFLLSFLPFAMATSAGRPYSTNFLLDQQEGDTGSASSLINFCWTLAGCLGMVVISGESSSIVMIMGAFIAGCSLVQLISWAGLLRSRIRCKGITCDE